MISYVPAPRIAGIVTAVPKSRMVNDNPALAKFVDATGVKQRRVAPVDVPFSRYAARAMAELIDKLGWQPGTIDALIVFTQTPDMTAPPTACLLHNYLKLDVNCAAFDVNLGCSGYPYALWMGAHMIATRDARRVLLVVGDVSSKMVDEDDPSTGALFGDAVSVTALEHNAAEPNPWTFVLGTDGSGFRALNCKPGGKLFMSGADVFSFAVKRVPGLFSDLLEASHKSRDDLDFILLHQANMMMLRHLARKINAPKAQFPINIERWGNTSSASIPLMLCDPQTGLNGAALERMSWMSMMGFGVGLSWAGVIGRFGCLNVAEVVEV